MINSSVQEHGNRDAQTESGISVLPFENGVSDQWDEFVLRQRSGSIFHTSAWKRAVERTFPYRACYLYAMRENRITGVRSGVRGFQLDTWQGAHLGTAGRLWRHLCGR